MPQLLTNGISLCYQRTGEGAPVLLIMGSNASGQVWTMHQTPALTKAGYECVTFDNRGFPPSEVPPGKYSLADMVADTRGLIEALDLGPCRIVATSIGAMIAQELAIAHPELVRCAVLIATKARLDPVRSALARGECELIKSGARRPPVYEAAVRAMQMLSPVTLNNPGDATSWLDLFEMTAQQGSRASGQTWADLVDDRRAALRAVTAPCRVIAFADDLMVPPYLCAEVAQAIPNCDLVRLADCGHLGFLERPDDVNAAIIEFLDAN